MSVRVWQKKTVDKGSRCCDLQVEKAYITLLNISLAGHEVSLIVSCVVAKHADETAYYVRGQKEKQRSIGVQVVLYLMYTVTSYNIILSISY